MPGVCSTSDARVRQFADHSSRAFWIADGPGGAFEYLSPAARRLLPPGCGGLGALDLSVHPEDRAAVAAGRRQAAAGLPQRFDYRLVEAGGQVRRMRETSFAIPDADGVGSAIGGIVEDATPERPCYLVSPAGLPHPALEQAVRESGHRLKTFASEALLALADVLAAGCVLVTADGPVEPLLRTLRQSAPQLVPVVVADGPAAPDAVVAAVRAGAAAYLVAPLTPAMVSKALDAAVDPPPPAADDEMRRRIAALPRRELEVLRGLLAGGTNKVIARALGISPRTVEVHRAHLTERLGARSLSDLMRIAVEAGVRGAPA